MRFADHPTALSDPSTGLVAIAWNGWSQSFGMAGRDQSESVVAITRCAHTLIKRTKNREFDSARSLLGRGIVGELEVWRHGASSPAMRLDIEKGARLTVEDGDCEGLRFVRWRPLSLDNVSDAVSCRAV